MCEVCLQAYNYEEFRVIELLQERSEECRPIRRRNTRFSEKRRLAESLAAVDHPVVLHGDNGSPLKAGTVYATMHALGSSPLHSRPRVSNDNPHADALVHTAGYHPSLPTQGFADLDEARRWAASFVHAYNRLHRRSTLRFVTPAQKYAREDRAILACNHCPERWVRNTTRNLTPRHHHHPQTH